MSSAKGDAEKARYWQKTIREAARSGVAVGRKNWQFFGSDNGGRTAAVLTSFITTCKRLDMDPFAYLQDIFDRISSHPKARLAELLADRWLAARQATALY